MAPNSETNAVSVKIGYLDMVTVGVQRSADEAADGVAGDLGILDRAVIGDVAVLPGSPSGGRGAVASAGGRADPAFRS
jgi:hypothetical protein